MILIMIMIMTELVKHYNNGNDYDKISNNDN